MYAYLVRLKPVNSAALHVTCCCMCRTKALMRWPFFMPKAANNISTTKCILFANIGQKTAVKCTHEYMKEKWPQKQIKERKKDQDLYITDLEDTPWTLVKFLSKKQIFTFIFFRHKTNSNTFGVLWHVSILTQLVFEL